MKHTLLILFTMYSYSIKAQSLVLNLSNGTQTSFPLSNISNITFNGNNMLVNQNNGTSITWDVDSINYYNYQVININTSTNEFEYSKEIFISPNPASSFVKILYKSEIPENISINVYDTKGRLIHSWPNTSLNAGNNEIIWYPKNISSGTYIINFSTLKSNFSKKIIID